MPPGTVLREFPPTSLGKVKLTLGNRQEIGFWLLLQNVSLLLQLLHQHFVEETMEDSAANFTTFTGRIFEKHTGYLSQELLQRNLLSLKQRSVLSC